jgi:transcriptional regulator with XRE-family HTH domain
MDDERTWLEIDRLFLGLTQVKLAEKLGITDRQIRKYESKRAEIPQKIRLAVNALLFEFMARENQKENQEDIDCVASKKGSKQPKKHHYAEF